MELPAGRFLAETDPVKPRRIKPQAKPHRPALRPHAEFAPQVSAA